MIKKGAALALGVLILAGCAAKGNAQDEAKSAEEKSTQPQETHSAYQDTTVEDFTFSWRVDDEDLLHVRVSAPTTGWVAVGFNPKTLMKDADLIMGYVKDGTAFFSDQFGTALTSHKPDTALGGEDNLVEREATEEEGVTRLHFAIPLDSGDPYDRVLERGETYKVILAYGGADNFSAKHKETASLKIKF